MVSNHVKEYFISYFSEITNYLYNKVIEPSRRPSKAFYKEDFIYKKLTENKYSFIKSAFDKAEQDLRYSNIDINFSGTTCNLIFLIENKIICASLGDSRGILMTENFDVANLSYDHKPDLPLERKRIEKMGGIIEKTYGIIFKFNYI